MATTWTDGDTREATALHGDVAGYSKLIADNEIETHQTLQTFRRIIEEETAARNGNVVQFAGDEFLAIIDTEADAVETALAIQRRLAEANTALPDGRQTRFRLGLNSGPISFEGGQWYGDTINVAARLQAMAIPGGMTVSAAVLDAAGEPAVKVESMGPQRLKNIPEPVAAYRIYDEAAAESDTKPWRRRIAPPTQLPSLAVSPFINLGDAEDSHLADGLMMELAISLMTIPGLQLVSENSTLGYRSQAFSAQQLGHELGVRHVLEGAVQRSGNQMRVTTQLIDTETGQTVWADRFQATLDDIFKAQDDIVQAIVAALDIEVLTVAGRMYRSELDAGTVEVLYRGLHHLSLGTAESFELASAAFDEVTTRYPDSAWGYSHAAIVHVLLALAAPAEQVGKLMELAETEARRALELDDPSGIGHAILAYALLLKRDYEGARRSAALATEARPSCDLSFGLSASVLRYLGDWEEAVDHADHATRLSPLLSNWYQTIQADAYFVGEQYSEAADTAEGVVAADEDNVDALLTLAAAQAALGRERHAAAAMKHAKSTQPKLTAQALREDLPFSDESITERFVERLEDAGLG